MPDLDLPHGRIAVHDEGSGPTLVFVHGLLVDSSLWGDVAGPLVAAGHRCVRPDLPLGAHRSAMRPEADLSPPGLARLVADLLEALDLRDVTLVGNDTGGAICQLVAAHHPERLGRLVLTNCDAYENFLPPVFRPLQWLARAPALIDVLLRGVRAAPLQRVVVAPVSKRIDGERLASWMAALPVDAGVRRDAIKVLAGVDSSQLLDAVAGLRRFDRPALIVWARGDRIFPLRYARRLEADLPHARLELVEDSRAFIPVDQPARLAELLRAFVREPVAA